MERREGNDLGIPFKTHTCCHCQPLLIDHYKQWRTPITRRYWGGLQVFDFSFTFKDLLASANESCLFSKWLLALEWQVEEDIRSERELDSIPNFDSRSCRLERLANILGDEFQYSKFCIQGSDDCVEDDDIHLATFGFCDANSGRLICTPDISILAWIERDKLPSSTWSSGDTFSDDAARSVLDVLKECQVTLREDHIFCVQDDIEFMPRRVIEVLDSHGSESLCLKETSGMKAESYVALSYCWGGDQKMKSTKDSAPRWRAGIPWSSLPKTLQDAITVCRKLRQRYLWVDAFCIIQDDDNDKLSEIIKMPEIYNNAMLTISASRAAGVTEGFLLDYATQNFTPNIFEIPYRTIDNTLLRVIVMEQKVYQSEPLDTRGWCLQESILSPRLLLFGARQVIYMCHGIINGFSISNQFKRGIEDVTTQIEEFQECRRRMGGITSWLRLPPENRTRRKPDDVERYWHILVQIFTRRNLTMAQDRVYAIAGIADMCGRVLNERYIAGHWESTFFTSLLWIVEKPEPPRRLRAWRAPSWSWFSASGPINFWKSGLSLGDTVDVKILDISLTLVDPHNPYGALTSGSITVLGRLLATTMSISSNGEDEGNAIWKSKLLKDGSKEPRYNGTAYYDHAGCDGSSGMRDCFLLALDLSPGYVDSCNGLVVEKVGTGNEFCRIGSFFQQPVFVDDVLAESIVLK